MKSSEKVAQDNMSIWGGYYFNSIWADYPRNADLDKDKQSHPMPDDPKTGEANIPDI
jgi:hypothetical protein